MEAEEAALEQQLQDHLVEHKASLCDIEEALACDPHNEELLEVHQELRAALKSAEESLLHLKRSRLLREIDYALESSGHKIQSTEERNTVSDAEASSLHGGSNYLSSDPPTEENALLTVGSKCRFRHSDGRWYYGKVIDLENGELANVAFLTPTTEKMQICKFYVEQRCRFGENCRMSHGVLLPLEALRPYNTLPWKPPCAGSAVLACSSVNGEGIWRQAEIESWNEDLGCGKAVFVDDGSSLEVKMENLCLSEYADVSDLESTSSDEGDETDIEDAEDDEEEYSCLGLGNENMASSGPQTDTRVFANWEKHTRGVASKMMLNMGYREGMGLGKTGQGMIRPIPTRVLPKGKSLDFIAKLDQGNDTEVKKKKKSRGGKRKRDKKFADAARLAKAAENKPVDVFGFINNQLYSQKGEEDKSDVMLGQSKISSHSQRHVKPRKNTDDRKSLMAQADGITELRSKVEKLQEMAARNRKDKSVHEAVSRKLQEARKELADAEASHASASLAVHSKEKEKKWLRF